MIEIIQGSIFETRLPPIHLTVTSPPYNIGMEYATYIDKMTDGEYAHFTRHWLSVVYDSTVPTGRLCVNIPIQTNTDGSKPFYADFISLARSEGWDYKTTICWNKTAIGSRLAWGSFASASAPHINPSFEMIVVLYKDSWKRDPQGESTISGEDFIEWTNGMWTFAPESATAIGHPAPFPVELPKRCIELFSFKGDMVLDPFCGSGTTLVACKLSERKGIGVEIDSSYCEIAMRRTNSAARQCKIHYA